MRPQRFTILANSIIAASEPSVCPQALNVLMLKVLENSCRTDIFVALLALSRGRPAELAAAPPEQAVKFFDLAVKCLIKLTKALTPTLEVRPAV